MRSLEIEKISSWDAKKYGCQAGDYIGKIAVSGKDYSTTVVIEPDDLMPILRAACGVIVKALRSTAEKQEDELMKALGETLGLEDVFSDEPAAIED